MGGKKWGGKGKRTAVVLRSDDRPLITRCSDGKPKWGKTKQRTGLANDSLLVREITVLLHDDRPCSPFPAR